MSTKLEKTAITPAMQAEIDAQVEAATKEKPLSTGRPWCIASLLFSLLAFFSFAPVFVPLAVLMIIIALIDVAKSCQRNESSGVIWLITAVAGVITATVTSPTLLALFVLAQ